MSFTDYRSTALGQVHQAVGGRAPDAALVADPQHGQFRDARALAKADIDRIVAWVDAGAPAGNPKDAPAPRQYTEGWSIPSPDLVVEMPKPFTIPASGKVDYQYIVIPLGLAEDKWVQMVEARPAVEARSAVHHILAYIRDPESNWLRGEAEPGVPFAPPKTLPNGRRRNDIGGMGNEVLTIYTPGNVPDTFEPGRAKLIRAGSDLVLQMHYTPNGKSAVVDRSKVGFVWAKEPPKERVMTTAVMNDQFVIPPGDPAFRVDADVSVPQPQSGSELLSTHAPSRQVLRVCPEEARREQGSAVARAGLRLQLAVDLPVEDSGKYPGAV